MSAPDPHEAIRAIATEHGLMVNIWSPEDVQSIRSGMSDEDAADALETVADRFNDRLTELGWDVLEDLLTFNDL